MQMQVFVQNEAGSNQKNLHDEKTLEYEATLIVSRRYPYPYGFILKTTSGDGDNLDCFVLTEQPLETGQIVVCEPVGMMGRSDQSHPEMPRQVRFSINLKF